MKPFYRKIQSVQDKTNSMFRMMKDLITVLALCSAIAPRTEGFVNSGLTADQKQKTSGADFSRLIGCACGVMSLNVIVHERLMLRRELQW